MTLENFKKSNKVRRESVAKKAGMSVEDYIKTLTIEKVCETKKTLTKKDKVVSTKKVIHNVVLLDSSGSMRGAKYENAILGIKEELRTITSTKDTTIYHYLYDFLDRDRSLNDKYTNKESVDIDVIPFKANGDETPLYKSIVNLLTILHTIPKNEKILVKIYTDGDNNCEYEYLKRCSDLIKRCNNENFTVTFVATRFDLNKIIKNLYLDDSNTLAVDNTGDGFKKAFDKSLIATIDYVTKVEKNEDVSSGFYKSVGKL